MGKGLLLLSLMVTLTTLIVITTTIISTIMRGMPNEPQSE